MKKTKNLDNNKQERCCHDLIADPLTISIDNIVIVKQDNKYRSIDAREREKKRYLDE